MVFPLIPIILGLSAITGAASAITKGNASRRQADEQARLSQLNAEDQAILMTRNIENQLKNADFTQKVTDFDVTQSKYASSKLFGSQRAAVGASGFDLSGSALDIFADTISQSELQTQSIKAAGEYSAQNYRNQAENERFRRDSLIKNTGISADSMRQAGRAAQTSGFIDAGSTILTSGAKIATGISGGIY